VSVTALPFVAWVIDDVHFLSSCLKAMPNNSRDQLWVCISAALRRDIPADVRFDDDLVPLPDEGLHAAERPDSLIKHRVRLTAFNRDKVVRQLSAAKRSKQTTGLHECAERD
jgi:hypothetical protein